MAISLGKDGTSPPGGDNIISASYTEECEVVDVTNRANCGGSAGSPGYKANMAGFKTRTWEVECHDVSSALATLQAQATNGTFTVMNISEKASVDGAVTYSLTLKEG